MLGKDITELVNRYEQMLATGKSVYFDADEFEDLAEYYDMQEDLDTAKEIIDAGLAIHPESTSLLLKKAKFLVYDGKYAKALRLAEKYMSEYDLDLYLLAVECYLQLDMYDEADDIASQIIENEEEDLATAYSELGFLYVESDRFEHAIEYFKKSLEYNNDNIEVLGDLAYAYEITNQFDEAIQTSNQILDIDSYTYDAWVNLGKLYSMTEQYEKAIDAFDFAITINDLDEAVLKLKAHCLTLCERAEEAIVIYKNLLVDEDADSSIYFLLVEALLSIDLFDDALGYIRKFEEKEGITPNSIAKKAYVYLQKGDNEKAWNTIESEVSAPQTSTSQSLMLAGEIKFKEEKYDEAESYFLQAYHFNPDSSHLIDRLSLINIRMGNYENAIHYTLILEEMEPYDTEVKYRLFLLYFEINEEAKFNELLDTFSEEEIRSLFKLIYQKGIGETLTREQLIDSLNEARECRTLFKNLKY